MTRAPIGKILRWTALGLALYLGFLIASLPAAWLALGVERASHGNVAIANANGTVWRGHGDLRVVIAASTQSLGRLDWRVDPWWLIAGRAQVALDASGPGTEIHTALRWGKSRLVINDLRASLPAQWLTFVYAPATFFAPTGELQLTTAELAIDHEGLHGNVELRWNGAGGRFTELPHLGDYRLALTGAGETAAIELSTISGSLDLSGKGQWRVGGDGEIRFQGTAAARADHGQLEPLLQTLGRDLGNGRRPINFTARAPLVNLLGL